MTVFAYLTAKPVGATLICLIVAIVLFVIAGGVAATVRAFYATLIAAGLAFMVLAYLLN